MINDIEAEIDEIRDDIYNEIKTLSISDRKNYFRKGAELTIEELGLRLINNTNTTDCVCSVKKREFANE